MNEQQPERKHFQAAEPDAFDRAYGQAQGFSHTRESVVTSAGVLGVGGVTQYTIQTFRVPEMGDSVFVWINGPDGALRVQLPPKVSNVIAAQRESLTAKSRKRAGAARALADKAAGMVPGFQGHEFKCEKCKETKRCRIGGCPGDCAKVCGACVRKGYLKAFPRKAK